MKYIQHIPDFVDVDCKQQFEFTTQDELLTKIKLAPVSSQTTITKELQVSKDSDTRWTLMEQYSTGKFWVAGFIIGTKEELSTLSFPEWKFSHSAD